MKNIVFFMKVFIYSETVKWWELLLLLFFLCHFQKKIETPLLVGTAVFFFLLQVK